MTELLQQAITEMQKLPLEEQEAFAARILAELTDERRWTARFKTTTDMQWDRLAETARHEIVAKDIVPLDDIVPPGESER